MTLWPGVGETYLVLVRPTQDWEGLPGSKSQHRHRHYLVVVGLCGDSLVDYTFLKMYLETFGLTLQACVVMAANVFDCKFCIGSKSESFLTAAGFTVPPLDVVLTMVLILFFCS